MLTVALLGGTSCGPREPVIHEQPDFHAVRGKSFVVITEGGPEGAMILMSGQERLLHTCSRDGPKGGPPYWQPTWDQIRALESQLPSAVRQDPRHRELHGTPPQGWIRQYIGLTKGGRQFVYGNFFLEDGWLEDMREVPPYPDTVCDGGPDFFGVTYSVRAGKITKVDYNGP